MFRVDTLPRNLKYFGGFPQDHGGPRPGVMLKGSWTQEVTDYINRHNIDALYLNQANGWDGGDCSFLAGMQSLRFVDILSYDLTGIRSIESLKHLEALSLAGPTNETIDFTQAPNLESVFLGWNKGYQSIFDCNKLKDIYIDSIKFKELPHLVCLPVLESLTIGNSPLRDIAFLENAPSLQKLELLNCRELEDFKPISFCTKLNWLSLSGCSRLFELVFVRSLDRLEYLNFSDVKDLKSIKPVATLESLKALCFTGTTVVEDGDFGFLEELPKLAMLNYAPRRHYSHKTKVRWNWDNFDSPSPQVERK